MAKTMLFSATGAALKHTLFHEEDGLTHFESIQDVDPVIWAAGLIADQVPDKDFRHTAFLPDVVYDRAVQEGWLHDKAKLKQWLNDPANDCFRTWKGQI